jgi:putative membrane-bound dehydrogenase-like protein
MRTFFFVAPVALCLAFCGAARSQGYSPDEAVRKMTTPDDLELQLVASEPMVRQPVCIEMDDRGRLWVIQYLQYPNPAGLKRAKVDRFSRTIYDRVPEPPPKGPRGADRITILEDTDGDGRADSSHDFVDGLNLATGLAFGYGGVFVMQVPYLLFYPDRDRDDVPDRDPQVLVTGFGMDDAHSVANSLTWGPDGWLYGCQGSTVTARIDGIEFQQGVWRYHPLERKFELFCEGGGNSWGLDFDRHGRLLYGTNFGGYRVLHAVPGGYYWKSFGKHGPLHNPFAYGYFDHAPHADFKGGHVTVGGIVYQGDGLPAKYRDKYLLADTLGHQLFWDKIEPRGSTVQTAYGGELAVGNDTWFAPCDVCTGPDGSVYFSDWHDARTAHPDPDADWDRRNGRIYRLRASGPLAPASGERVRERGRAAPDWPNLNTAELIALHRHPNDWIVRRARRILTERRDPEALLPLQTLALTSDDPQFALEYFWTFASCGGLTAKTAPAFLEHANADIRRWTVQFLGDEPRLPASLAERLTNMAADEPDVSVRTLLACTARRLPPDQSLPILQRLLLRDEDLADPYQPLLLWWGVEQHSLEARREWVEWFCSAEAGKSALVTQIVAPRLIRRYAAEGTPLGLASAGELIAALQTVAERHLLFEALDQGLGEQSPPLSVSWNELPARLQETMQAAWTEDTLDSTLLRLGLRFHLPAAERRVRELVTSSKAPSDVRQRAIRDVAELSRPSAIEPLLAVLQNGQETAPIRLAAIESLQRFPDERIRDVCLKLYGTSADPLRRRLGQALLSRPDWARAYLHEFLAGRFDVKDLKAEDWQTIVADLDETSRDEIIKTWGSVAPPTPGERLAEVRRLNNDLRASVGDPAAGKRLFGQHCAICHKLHGEGFNVGPDLTHANRKDRDYLLLQLVDPSAIIRKEYLAYTASTVDGRVVTGLLVNQNAAEITLMAAKEEKTTVPVADLDELHESSTSLMPENVLKQLKPQELRDLFAFLQSEP